MLWWYLSLTENLLWLDLLNLEHELVVGKA
jgi:hypothetical protein